MSPMLRTSLLVGCVLLGLGALAFDVPGRLARLAVPPPPPDPLTMRRPYAADPVAAVELPLAHPSAPTTVLVVFDTTRSDRLSACGYPRPTSPTLERLVAEGASLSCDAVSAGTWTVPSHASLFTGASVIEHQTDNARLSREKAQALGGLNIGPSVSLQGQEEVWVTLPLESGFETVAESRAKQGVQTVLVSANRVIAEPLGLTQGFQQTRYAVGEAIPNGPLFPGDPVPHVREALSELDPTAPLFLYVNFFYAHDPFPAVPSDVGWVPEREPLIYLPFTPEDPWTRYADGAMGAEEADAFRAHLSDVYDYGVRRNDDGLAALLELLESSGWTSAGLRLVVVSDHGELLGEHGHLEHGLFTWEEVARVPLLVHDTAGTPTLPEGPLSTRVVYDLLERGELPDPLPAPAIYGLPMWWSTMIAAPEADRPELALYDGERKLVWRGGFGAHDLATDPDEAVSLPVTSREHSLLEREVAGIEAVATKEVDPNEEILQALEAAGYLER